MTSSIHHPHPHPHHECCLFRHWHHHNPPLLLFFLLLLIIIIGVVVINTTTIVIPIISISDIINVIIAMAIVVITISTISPPPYHRHRHRHRHLHRHHLPKRAKSRQLRQSKATTCHHGFLDLPARIARRRLSTCRLTDVMMSSEITCATSSQSSNICTTDLRHGMSGQFTKPVLHMSNS